MPRVRVRAVRVAATVAVSALLLAACGSGSGGTGPTWKPKPSFNGEGNPPGGQQPGAPQNPAQSTAPGTPQPSPSGKGDPNVVATKLDAPVGIAILPDNTALVGERTTGRIVRVQPEPNKPVRIVRTLPGINGKGDGGLLDLALSPNYSEDNLIFAYETTRTDNRVVAFTLNGPVTTVVKGIPRAAIGNTGRIAFMPDGTLLIGTGDAGRPALASSASSLAGKILRVTDIGAPAPRNPHPGSRMYASGLRQSDGVCADAAGNIAFQTEALDTGAPADPINLVTAGASYGFGRSGLDVQKPLATLPQTSSTPGGCAVLNGQLFTTTLDGKALLAAPIKASNGDVALGQFKPMLRDKYGRLRTVVAAPDGALWLTTSNRDGNGTPVPTDERVLRIVPSSSGGDRNPT